MSTLRATAHIPQLSYSSLRSYCTLALTTLMQCLSTSWPTNLPSAFRDKFDMILRAMYFYSPLSTLNKALEQISINPSLLTNALACSLRREQL